MGWISDARQAARAHMAVYPDTGVQIFDPSDTEDQPTHSVDPDDPTVWLAYSTSFEPVAAGHHDDPLGPERTMRLTVVAYVQPGPYSGARMDSLLDEVADHLLSWPDGNSGYTAVAVRPFDVGQTELDSLWFAAAVEAELKG